MAPRTLTLRLAYAIFAIAFGSGFQHGYNTGVLNAPQALITEWIKDCDQYANKTVPEDSGPAPVPPKERECRLERASLWGFIVAAFCIGGVVGGSLVGLVSEKIGRRGGLLLNNSCLLFVAGSSMVAAKYANTYLLLIFGRFLIGINAGLNAGIAPMYLSEISPVALRGSVGTAYQLVITISILLSQVLGMKGVLGNDWGWPFLLGITILPGIIQLFTLPICPESPKYLLLVREEEERTERALKWLRGEDGDVQGELEEMRAEREAMRAEPPVTLRAMLSTAALRKPLVIAAMMMLAQQLSGINAAFYFSTSIFESAGLAEESAQMATLGVGLVNVVMTFVSLALIDSCGRKTLMIAGLGIMNLASWGLFLFLLFKMGTFSVVSLIVFVVGFAIGPGGIPWFFVTELFAQSGRPTATSIAVVVNWVANFMVGFLFEPLRLAMGGGGGDDEEGGGGEGENGGAYVFLIFIVMQIVFMIYIKVVVPETRNRSIEDITALFD